MGAKEFIAKRRRPGLSSASPYETLFETRHRGAGRPVGGDVVFEGASNVDPVIASVARRRAFAVVHEEQRARLSEVFEAEVAVLKRRGVDQVLIDIGRGANLAATHENGPGTRAEAVKMFGEEAVKRSERDRAYGKAVH